jgi:hypothetical protein
LTPRIAFAILIKYSLDGLRYFSAGWGHGRSRRVWLAIICTGDVYCSMPVELKQSADPCRSERLRA